MLEQIFFPTMTSCPDSLFSPSDHLLILQFIHPDVSLHSSFSSIGRLDHPNILLMIFFPSSTLLEVNYNNYSCENRRKPIFRNKISWETNSSLNYGGKKRIESLLSFVILSLKLFTHYTQVSNHSDTKFLEAQIIR